MTIIFHECVEDLLHVWKAQFFKTKINLSFKIIFHKLSEVPSIREKPAHSSWGLNRAPLTHEFYQKYATQDFLPALIFKKLALYSDDVDICSAICIAWFEFQFSPVLEENKKPNKGSFKLFLSKCLTVS